MFSINKEDKPTKIFRYYIPNNTSSQVHWANGVPEVLRNNMAWMGHYFKLLTTAQPYTNAVTAVNGEVARTVVEVCDVLSLKRRATYDFLIPAMEHKLIVRGEDKAFYVNPDYGYKGIGVRRYVCEMFDISAEEWGIVERQSGGEVQEAWRKYDLVRYKLSDQGQGRSGHPFLLYRGHVPLPDDMKNTHVGYWYMLWHRTEWGTNRLVASYKKAGASSYTKRRLRIKDISVFIGRDRKMIRSFLDYCRDNDLIRVSSKGDFYLNPEYGVYGDSGQVWVVWNALKEE